MKTKIALFGILAISLVSCTAPGYLSTSDKIDVNPYGARIVVHSRTSPAIAGELISVDTSKIIVLKDINFTGRSERTTVTIPINEINRYTVQYARSKSYGWSLPVFTLATISHGWWLVFTAPLNILVTSLVISTGNTDFQYKSKNISYEELKMFSRFPQGIPQNIDLSAIK